MKKNRIILLLVCILSIVLVGCTDGENSNKNSQIKDKIQESSNKVKEKIEQVLNKIEVPEIKFIQGEDWIFKTPIYKIAITAKEDNTVINDVVVNRGNCIVDKYRGINSKKAQEYANEYPQNVKIASEKQQNEGSLFHDIVMVDKNKGILLVDTKNNEKIIARSSIYKADKENIAYLQNLNDESRSLYIDVFPLKLDFAGKYELTINCDIGDILEVVLKTNGGDFKYTPTRRY